MGQQAGHDMDNTEAQRVLEPARQRAGRRLTPWSAPLVVAVLIAAGVLAPRAFAANPHPTLPARSASQLVTAAESSTADALSGTIHTDAHLGLPSLPDEVGASNGLTALVSGTNTVRVWVRDAQHQRLALLGSGSEMDLIHDGRAVWTWNSATQSVMHAVLPQDATSADSSGTPAEQLTPSAQARELLRSIDPSTVVAVTQTVRVAGRPAYTLTLTPRTAATLVGSVKIAVDAATSVPLGVWIYPRGASSPAFSTAFTSVSFATPSLSNFAFTPPGGARVTQRSLTSRRDRHPGAAGAKSDAGPTVVGKGWTSVLEFSRSSVTGSETSGRAVKAQGGSSSPLDDLTNPVAQGRLLTTRLLSVLITKGGEVLIGAVPAPTLEALADGAGT